MAQAEQYLQEALEAFDFGGQVVGAVRYGSGHINDTFCVHTQPGEDPCRRFILQRISTAAFHHPDQVMANIVGVTSFLGKQIAAAGLDSTQYSAHKLRHTAATLMLQNGVDVRTLQEVLGHENLNTTQIYTHVDNENLRSAAKANPLGRVKARKKPKSASTDEN